EGWLVALLSRDPACAPDGSAVHAGIYVADRAGIDLGNDVVRQYPGLCGRTDGSVDQPEAQRGTHERAPLEDLRTDDPPGYRQLDRCRVAATRAPAVWKHDPGSSRYVVVGCALDVLLLHRGRDDLPRPACGQGRHRHRADRVGVRLIGNPIDRQQVL